MNGVLAEDTNWMTCPVCGSIQIEGGHVEIEGIEAYQEVSCLHCQATWREVYAALQRDNIQPFETMFEVSFRFFTEATYIRGTDVAKAVEDAAVEHLSNGRVEYVKVVG